MKYNKKEMSKEERIGYLFCLENVLQLWNSLHDYNKITFLNKLREFLDDEIEKAKEDYDERSQKNIT